MIPAASPEVFGAMKLLYFAWLRARIGHAEEELPLPAEVRDVAGAARLAARRAGRAMPRRCATSRWSGSRSTRIMSGATTRSATATKSRLFPPVTGG